MGRGRRGGGVAAGAGEAAAARPDSPQRLCPWRAPLEGAGPGGRTFLCLLLVAKCEGRGGARCVGALSPGGLRRAAACRSGRRADGGDARGASPLLRSASEERGYSEWTDSRPLYRGREGAVYF